MNLIDSYVDPNENYAVIVMEKADMSLDRLIGKGCGLELGYIVQMMLDILVAVEYAHTQKNISHYDIKPGNVLVFKNIDRAKEKAQSDFVREKTHIFKLADWSCSKMAGQFIDKTISRKDIDGGTISFAAPEILNGNKMQNFSKTDIYSFGLCIFKCCGANSDEFRSLNFLTTPNEHSELFAKLLVKFKIKENYGELMVNLLKNTVSFNSADRWDLTKIKSEIKEIIKTIKDQKNCHFCKKMYHAAKVEFPGCGHFFGTKCLNSFYDEELKKNKLTMLKCPKEDCPIFLKPEDFETVFEETVYKKYFKKCSSCRFVSYKSIFIEIPNCNHSICSLCFHKTIDEKKTDCPVDLCKNTWNNELGNTFLKSCLGCEGHEKIPLHTLDCCRATVCSKFLRNIIDFQLKFSTDKNIFCVFCGKKLENAVVLKIKEEENQNLDKDNNGDIKIEMEKTVIKKICSNCGRETPIFLQFDCFHTFCPTCIKTRIELRLIPNKNHKNLLKCFDESCELFFKIEKLIGFLELHILLKLKQIILQCQMCQNDIQTNGITLECKHRYCKNCIVKNWNLKIEEGVCDITCLHPTCSKQINYNFLKIHLDQEIFQKYDDLLLKRVLAEINTNEQQNNFARPKQAYIINKISPSCVLKRKNEENNPIKINAPKFEEQKHLE